VEDEKGDGHGHPSCCAFDRGPGKIDNYVPGAQGVGAIPLQPGSAGGRLGEMIVVALVA
jgi:hypothetical protein